MTGGTSPVELDAQGALEMSQAEQSAKTAALRHLGYACPATPAGAVIAGTFPGTPAYGVLDVGDVVTAVDGTPTPSAEALTTAAVPVPLGPDGHLLRAQGRHGRPVPVSLTAAADPWSTSAGRPWCLDVGIEPEDQVDYTYPFPVSIDVVDIGGPSAGLAMTLGVIDALSGGSLTGGHTVAATGTMDASGDVGDVGGVRPEDRGRRERRRHDLPGAAPGVPGGHVEGPARAEDLRGVHAGPGPGRARGATAATSPSAHARRRAHTGAAG